MLNELISRYRDAQKVWEDQFDQDAETAADSSEWKEYMGLSSAIIDFRCSTMAEIRQRAEFMLSQENLVDILANCSTDVSVRDFLKSMIDAPVDNGEKRS